MKCIVITLIVSIATLILGLYFGWKYIGTGESIATIYALRKAAVQDKKLSNEEFLKLTEEGGKILKKENPSVADAFRSLGKSATINEGSADLYRALLKGIEAK